MSNTYCEIALKYLEQNGKITNGDIINITHTNCPHSVIRDLRKKGIKLREEVKKNNGKTFKVYYLEDAPPKREIVKDMPEPVGQIMLGLKLPQMGALERRQKYGF